MLPTTMAGHFLGDVGSLLQKKQPNFDSRNYGYQKLTPLIQALVNLTLKSAPIQKADSSLSTSAAKNKAAFQKIKRTFASISS
jgi:hypothetical protein